jgi:uncharacterized protein YecT (DUF1311 family)
MSAFPTSASRWILEFSLVAVAAATLSLAACATECGRTVRNAGEKPEEICSDQQSQLALGACFAAAARNADRVVAERQSELDVALKASGPAVLALARESEQRWGLYRDSQCSLYRQRHIGGSAESMEENICRWRLGTEHGAELYKTLQAWAPDR